MTNLSHHPIAEPCNKFPVLFISRRMTAILLALILMIAGGCSGKEGGQPIVSEVQPNMKQKDEQTQSSSSSAAGEAAADKVEGVYSYNAEGRRDPFKSLLTGLKEKKTTGLTPLQQRSLSELRVIGIVWEDNGHLAMIETPDGKGFLIKEGTPVGPDGGVIKTITNNSVIIEEGYVDYYGKKKYRETVLRLHSKEEGGG